MTEYINGREVTFWKVTFDLFSLQLFCQMFETLFPVKVINVKLNTILSYFKWLKFYSSDIFQNEADKEGSLAF